MISPGGIWQEEYSQVERFAPAYWSEIYDENNFVIALSGYTGFFDRSADPHEQSTGGTVVAGFASTVEQWTLWDKEWNAVLKDFNVPYFHMKEFNSASSSGAFSGKEWSDASHRGRFVAHLIATINKWAVVAVADHIEHQMYWDANSLCEVDRFFNPYAECARNCVLQVRSFIREKLQSSLPITYVFDVGDEGRGMLIDLMTRCQLPAPDFKRSRPDPKRPQLDIDDPPMVQLQAADLLAWEIRRWKNDYRDGKRMRRSLQAFLKMGKERIIWKECTYTAMANVIHSIGIPRRGIVNIENE